MVVGGLLLLATVRRGREVCRRFAERYPEGIAALNQWMAEGKIKIRLDVVDGLENALQTVKKLFTGGNTGKLMIRVQDV